MKIYGPYLRKDGRYHVIVKGKTISYPKFLIENKTGRKLKIHETIDHKDGNIANNSLSNLQILSRTENIRKSLKIKKMFLFICPVCKILTVKPLNKVKHNKKQGKSGPYCGKSCAGKIHN